MRKHFILVALVLLCGCSKLADRWTCSVMSGHEQVVFEKKVEYDSKKMLSRMKEIAKSEDLMFGQKNVEIVTRDSQMNKLLIEACSSKVQILADNFESKDSFRIYVRAPNKNVNSETKRVIKTISNYR